MDLTYEVKENGYVIYNNGIAWIVQEDYIPYPASTLSESAQIHIAEVLSNYNVVPSDPIQDQLDAINIAIAQMMGV